MKTNLTLKLLCFGILHSACCLSGLAQGTAFTYQGRLTDTGALANGNYDLRFTLYDAAGGGNVTGGPLSNTPTAVSNGLFTVTLDFGAGAFPGAGRWLEIDVRTNGGGAFIPLSARQQLASTPYAIIAGDVTGANIARLTVPNTSQQATGTPVVTSGFITGANLTFGGTGYSTPPLVTVSGSSGSGAVVTATVSNGMVIALMAQTAGIGYPTNATLTIAPPPSNANQTFASTNFFTGVNILSNVNNTISGNGAGLTGLNASQIISGTIADAQLSSNVALLNGSQTFTGPDTFNTNVGIAGMLSVNNVTPASALTVAGDIQMAGGAAAYHNFSLSGGNSSGFLYGAYTPLGDGIHLGYNFYYDANGNAVIPNSNGGTSRISVGYGTISLLTGYGDSAPYYGLTINAGSVSVTTTSTGIGINGVTSPQETIDMYGSIIYRGNGIWNAGINSAGNFGFVPSAAGLDVAYIDTSGNYHQVSDLQLKRDIANLDNTLERLLNLRPVSYHFHDAPTNAPLSLGFIAQEVQPLFPEIVGEQTNGVKDLVYSELVPVAIRSIQELNQKVEAQLKAKDSEMQALQRQNDALAGQLKELQAAVKSLRRNQ